MYIPDTIHVVGDSHCLFWDAARHKNITPPPRKMGRMVFKTHFLGSGLAYNTNKYGSTAQCRENFDKLLQNNFGQGCNGIRPVVMTSFGEIDIRVHIFKPGYSNYIGRINDAIANYLEFIEMYSQQVNFIVYGPIASQKDAWKENPGYPRHGNELDRNVATMIFTENLRKECKKRNIFFFSLFDRLVDTNLRTIAKNICDECHLGDEIYIEAVNAFNKQYTDFLFERTYEYL